MASSQETAQRPGKRNLTLYLISLSLLAVVFVASAEFVLRQKGFKPWQAGNISAKVEPGGRLFRPHPALGYSHIPGSFVVTLPTGYSFKSTHLPNTLRITRPLDSYDEPSRKEGLWIFGCSMTYGLSLNDEETYPWLLQERLPQYDVVNFSVPGYGTTHSLIQFREALAAGAAPKVAILAYAGFHDERNTFSRMRRKQVAPWNRLGPFSYPCARLENGVLRYLSADVEYQEFPLMRRLAFAHYLEMTYNRLEFSWHQGQSVSEALIAEMAGLARKHGSSLIVANISRGQAMLDWARSNGIPNVDISLDLSIGENTNLPHDGHPSAIATRKYADKLETFLRTNIVAANKANLVR
jgi:hypothetical protein